MFDWKRLILVALITLCLSGCYVMKQAYYQGNLLATREPVDALIWHPRTDPKLKRQLIEIKEILAFAKKSGLNVGRAYSTYIEAKSPVVSYLVFAAEKAKLKQKLWSFPIVGRVPYLGFFLKEDRDKEAKSLEAEGFDVYVGSAGAFSSLGWFDDPIYGSMLNNEKDEIVHTLFHELVHRSFWVPNEANFNENLAEYLAYEMTVQYLNKKGLSQEKDLYLKRLGDRILYKTWLKNLRARLEKLYASPAKAHKGELYKEKALLFTKALRNLPVFATNSYSKVAKIRWNNATVLASSIYLPDPEPFAKAFHCLKPVNVGTFLQSLELAIDQSKSAAGGLESLCARGENAAEQSGTSAN